MDGVTNEKNTHSAMKVLDVKLNIVVNTRTFNGGHHNP